MCGWGKQLIFFHSTNWLNETKWIMYGLPYTAIGTRRPEVDFLKKAGGFQYHWDVQSDENSWIKCFKAEFHLKVKLPLNCFLPPPVSHLTPFRGGGGTGTCFWEVPFPTSGRPGHGPVSKNFGPFLHRRANENAQRSSHMRSRDPGVKPKGFTAGFPYLEWQWLHLTVEPKDRLGCRHHGLPGQVSVHIVKVNSYSICSCWLLHFFPKAELRNSALRKKVTFGYDTHSLNIFTV